MQQEDIKRDGQEDEQQPFCPIHPAKGVIGWRAEACHQLFNDDQKAKGDDGADQFKRNDIFIQDNFQFSKEGNQGKGQQGGVIGEQEQAEVKVNGIGQEQ